LYENGKMRSVNYSRNWREGMKENDGGVEFTMKLTFVNVTVYPSTTTATTTIIRAD
jgi:hypothetical protein